MANNRIMHALIVENKPENTQRLRLALQHSGASLELAAFNHGAEALAFLRQEADFVDAHRPDLILLDFNLPEMSSIEFLATVKADKTLCAIPVVVISDSILNEDILVAYQGGVAGYLVRPADADQCILAIRKLCQYWFTLVRLPESLE